MRRAFSLILLVLTTAATLDAGSQRLKYRVSWLGNSFAGASKWVQQDVEGMFVTADGTVYTNVGWDEAGREVGVYKGGDAIGIARHTHGWGYHGGPAIAANRKYVYFAQAVENEGGHLKDPGTWPPKGKGWFGLSRRLRADVARPALFAGGKGGKGDTLKGCFLLLNEVPEKTKAAVTGLWADDRLVYVSNPWGGEVRVYDAESMALVRRWPVQRPGPMAMDEAGTLWILQAPDSDHASSVQRYTTAGKLLPQKIAFPDGVVPTSLCFDRRGRLLVSDDGVGQQIRIYTDLDKAPRLSGTFGTTGGIYAGTPGEFGDLRFNRPSALGCDGAGNIYVASHGSSGGGSTVLESYTPSGKLNWRLFGLEFVDRADVDPASDVDVFTKEEHFRMDYTRPAGRQWAYKGYTIHRFRYPEDPRLHIWSAGAWVRRIEGRRFLFVTEMNARYLQVYRFSPQTDGEIAIPSGLFAGRRIQKKDGWPLHQPAKGEWVWRDHNGNGAFDEGEYDTRSGSDAPGYQGWWVDSAGTVWQATETAGIRQFPLQGLDTKGNPVWTYRTMRTFPRPTKLARVKRLRYDPEHDTLYLGGTTAEHRNQHWKPMGPVICRYDGWSRADRTLRWRIVAPYEKGSSGHSSCEPMGFDVAGDYLFVPYTGASRAMGVRTGHIEVFRLADGSPVGHMEPSPEIGEIGLQDIRECLRAHRRADGEYLIFLEEDWKAKILMYRWRP